MRKVPCDKYKDCLKNKKFDPFCYEIGPEEEKRIKKQGKIVFVRSGTCWTIITGKVYWKEVK